MAHYFAYTSMIDPDEIARVAPGARFHLIAHLPEAKMLFEMANGRWPGAIPTVVAEEGNSVWGAVFEVTKAQLAAVSYTHLRAHET